MTDEHPHEKPAPLQTTDKSPPGHRPITRPDPDRVAQGDEAAEHEKQRARRDVSEGGGDAVPAEPEDERADRMTERALKARPAVMP